MCPTLASRAGRPAVLDRPAVDGPPDGFFDVARRVYRDDPRWIPEDEEGLRARFSSDNPWFERGDAHLWCMPERSRLAAFMSPDTRVDAVPAAFFGYWETQERPGTDAVVFGQAEAWARRRGAHRLYGPIDFSTFDRYRLCTGGDATTAPFPQEPFNPPGYPALLTALGFRPTATSYASLVLTRDLCEHLAGEYRPHLDRVLALGYRIEPLSTDAWLADLRPLHGLCDAVFGEQFAYTPITFEEFSVVCGESYARRMAPDLSFLGRAPDGSLAAVVVNSPDWSPLLAQGNPARLRARELAHDLHRPLLARHGPANALIRTGGVVPRHRGVGLAYAFLARVFAAVAEGDWDRATVGIVTAGNAIDHLLRRHEPAVRTYALYQKDLT
jgi:hypothetical protein